MLVVTLQRDKCIGCNYCEELCPSLFKMSKKDGKSVLLKVLIVKDFTLSEQHLNFTKQQRTRKKHVLLKLFQ